MNKKYSLVASALAALALTGAAYAAPITVTGSSTFGGDTLSAQATFDIVGSQLIVTLRNTAPDDTTGQFVPQQGLSGIFFNLPDAITLTAVSATITSGQIIQGDQCDVNSGPPTGDNAANCTSAQTDVGGEFAYALTSLGGADRGISSSGLGIFGPGDVFGSPDLDSPDDPDGFNFELISANETAFNPNPGLSAEPLIQGTVTFVLDISGGTLSTSDISNFRFQYGTSTTEPSIIGECRGDCSPQQQVPEPGTLLILAPALLGLGLVRRRRAR